MYSFSAFASRTSQSLRKHSGPALAQVAFDVTRSHWLEPAPQRTYHGPRAYAPHPLTSVPPITATSNPYRSKWPAATTSAAYNPLPLWSSPVQAKDIAPSSLSQQTTPTTPPTPAGLKSSLVARLFHMPKTYCDESSDEEENRSVSESTSLEDPVLFGLEKNTRFIEPSFIPNLAYNIQHHCGVQVLIEKPREILAPYVSVSSLSPDLLQIKLEPLCAQHAQYHEARMLQKDMTLMTLSALPEPVIIEVEMRFQNKQDARELLMLLREIAVSRNNVGLKFKKCGICEDSAIEKLMGELSGVEHHANIVFLDKKIDDLESHEKRPRRKLGAL